MTNSFEEMENLNFEHEKEAKREIEKIEMAEVKVAERYGEYEVLKSFVRYIASMEKVFARARIYGSGRAFVKNELIKTEMYIYGQDSGIDEDVLLSIKNDFSDLYLTITQIYSITEGLQQKFAKHPECKKFIDSIRDIALAFAEVHERDFSLDKVEESVYLMKMKSLSESGDPSLILLEGVYEEFKKEISMRTSA